MFAAYLEAAMTRAEYEQLDDAPEFFGRIPDFQGVWATGVSIDDCRRELGEVLEEWVLLRITAHLDLPSIGEVELRIPEVA